MQNVSRSRHEEQVITKLLLTIGVTSTVSLVLFFALYLTMVKKGRRIQPYSGLVCLTDDCYAHSFRLLDSMNRYASPCEDFYEFVCGNRRTPRKFSGSVQDDMFFDAAEAVMEHLSHLGSHKAGELYKLCVHQRHPYIDNPEALQRFLKNRGLSWPEAPTEGRHPLDIMLELAIKWRIAPWLDVRILEDSKTRPLVLVIHRGTLGRKLPIRFPAMKPRDTFAVHVQRYLDLFHASSDLNVSELQADERLVLEKLATSTGSNPVEDVFVLKDIARYTPTMPAELWLRLLNQHYDPYFKFRLEDLVLVEDANLLRALADITTALSRRRLVSVMGWTLVQEYVWTVTDEGPLLSDARQRYACLESTTASYGVLSIIDNIVKQFPDTNRRRIDALLRSVKTSLINLIGISPWIDEATKAEAVSKVQTLSHTLWPPYDAFNISRLVAYYETFPNASASLLLSYTKAARTVGTLVTHVRFQDVYAKSLITPYGFFNYFYFLNVANVAINALMPPLYYGNGTIAMNYGGLVSAYAKQVVRALDPRGLSVNVMGGIEGWWNPASTEAYLARVSCNVSKDRVPGRAGLLFPLIPALETSYHAYLHAMYTAGATDPPRLKNLEEFSSQQIFFMSYCYGLCSKTKEFEDECNVPLMNFSPFAEAFNCSEDSRMSPARKCRFFDD